MEQEVRERLGQAEDRIAERRKKISGLEEKIGVLEELLNTSRTQLAEKERVLSAFSERENVLNRTLAERNQQFMALQEQLKSEFENIASKVLASTATQLSEKSQERLIAILDPLKTRLTDIQQKVESGQLEDTRQRAALGEQIRQVAQINQAIGLEAQNLTKALKGDSQARGRWGEMRLERILEKSGLERGKEFQVQGSDVDIRTEDGGGLRPDVVILLPEDRHFVIDSKVSLVDYLEYEAADSDELRAKSLKKLLSCVRGHIDDLAGKNYQYANAINSHDLVFMFIPIEGVTGLVLRNDESIFDYAWNRKIVITSPSTLFMTMRTVGTIWRYERQSKNAQAIADSAGEIYDKLVGVVGDLNDVTQKIQAAADAHNAAMKRLATGKGNALSRAEKLKLLGVSSKKGFPGILLDGAEHIVDADDGESAASDQGARVQLERPTLS
jgi:DNA recombination protein RmuC